MAEIRIYCEGGNKGTNTKVAFREGMRKFLNELFETAGEKRLKLFLTICGGRGDAYNDFKTALKTHKDAINILLVDSEAPVSQTPWKHLKQNDNWESLGSGDNQCHLMVQTTEAWILADPDALATFYGQGFNANSLPKNRNVEQIDKPVLIKSLSNAIRQTNKPEYHKIHHGAKLLGLIAPIKVRQASEHCDRMFTTISSLINDAG